MLWGKCGYRGENVSIISTTNLMVGCIGIFLITLSIYKMLCGYSKYFLVLQDICSLFLSCVVRFFLIHPLSEQYNEKSVLCKKLFLYMPTKQVIK